MKKVQLFSANNIEDLQQKINTWLANNKDINVIETNLNTINKPDTIALLDAELYSFYILYDIVNQKAKEKEQQLQLQENVQSIMQPEVKEELLNPTNQDIEKPTNQNLNIKY